MAIQKIGKQIVFILTGTLLLILLFGAIWRATASGGKFDQGLQMMEGMMFGGVFGFIASIIGALRMKENFLGRAIIFSLVGSVIVFAMIWAANLLQLW